MSRGPETSFLEWGELTIGGLLVSLGGLALASGGVVFIEAWSRHDFGDMARGALAAWLAPVPFIAGSFFIDDARNKS